MAQQTKKRESKPIGGELVIPVGALVFTLYYFYTIIDAPWTAQVSAFFVGTILIVLLILYFIRFARAILSGEGDLRLGKLIEPTSFIPKRIALLALTLGFIVFVKWLGFTLTVFSFLTLATLLLRNGRDKGLVLAVAGTLALGGYLLFIVAFQTRFPAGPFELLMQALF